MPNLNKYTAYRNIAENYDAAVQMMLNKPLVLGESAVVPFYYGEGDSRNVRLLFGIGSLNGSVEIINWLLSDSSNGTTMTIMYSAGQSPDETHWTQIQSTTPFLEYRVTVDNDGDFIFIAVPISMPVGKIRVNGENIDYHTKIFDIDGKPYTIYISGDPYRIGTYSVTLSGEISSEEMQQMWRQLVQSLQNGALVVKHAHEADHVEWESVDNKPNEYNPSVHTQDSSSITSMDGYEIQESYSPISEVDTLNEAIGKLEAGLQSVDSSVASLGSSAVSIDEYLKNTPQIIHWDYTNHRITISDGSTAIVYQMIPYVETEMSHN